MVHPSTFLAVFLSTSLCLDTFGPIAFAVQRAYDWSDGTIATLLNWGPIMYLIMLMPVSYIMEKYGLRWAVLFGSSCTAAGSALRAIPVDGTAFLMFSHLGSMVNGISGIMSMSLPAQVAAVWFPEGERIFAISVAQVRITACIII